VSTCAARCRRGQFKTVHDAFVNYEVIVLRDQDITVDQQMAFGALFGELSIHPFSPNLPDKPEVIILDYSADNPPALTDIWHVDETFREAPADGHHPARQGRARGRRRHAVRRR
jgi:taurine dioxygenase